MVLKALAGLLAANRVGFGGAMLVAPKLAAGWIGRDAARGRVQVMTRATGARDLALGAGSLGMLLTGRPARPWFAAQLVADASDFAATCLAREKLPTAAAKFALGMAAGSSAIAAAYVAFGEREPADDELPDPADSAGTFAPRSSRFRRSTSSPSGSST